MAAAGARRAHGHGQLCVRNWCAAEANQTSTTWRSQSGTPARRRTQILFVLRLRRSGGRASERERESATRPANERPTAAARSKSSGTKAVRAQAAASPKGIPGRRRPARTQPAAERASELTAGRRDPICLSGRQLTRVEAAHDRDHHEHHQRRPSRDAAPTWPTWSLDWRQMRKNGRCRARARPVQTHRSTFLGLVAVVREVWRVGFARLQLFVNHSRRPADAFALQQARLIMRRDTTQQRRRQRDDNNGALERPGRPYCCRSRAVASVKREPNENGRDPSRASLRSAW
jgi:hypothetical protein